MEEGLFNRLGPHAHSSPVLQYAPNSRVTGPLWLVIVAALGGLVFSDGGADIPVCHVGADLRPARGRHGGRPSQRQTPHRGVSTIDGTSAEKTLVGGKVISFGNWGSVRATR